MHDPYAQEKKQIAFDVEKLIEKMAHDKLVPSVIVEQINRYLAGMITFMPMFVVDKLTPPGKRKN